MKITLDVSEYEEEFAECKPGDAITITIEGTVTDHSGTSLGVEVDSMTKEKYEEEDEEDYEEEVDSEAETTAPPAPSKKPSAEDRKALIMIMKR